MKIKIIGLVSVCLVAAGAGIWYGYSTSSQSTTVQAELKAREGDCSAAAGLFYSALEKSADSRQVPFIPEKMKARVLDPALWRTGMADYLRWLFAETKSQSQSVPALLEQMERCTTGIQHENYFLVDSSRMVSNEEFQSRWVQVFCPETTAAPAQQEPLIQNAFKKDLSIVTVHGEKSFRYEICVVDRISGKKSDLVIDYERELSFPIRPGRYCVFCVSRKKYSVKQEFESGRDMLSFTAPDSASAVFLYFRTRIKRVR